LIIKACLGVIDEEMVEQIKENPYLQFFIGLEGYQFLTTFDPSTMKLFQVSEYLKYKGEISKTVDALIEELRIEYPELNRILNRD